MPIGITLSREFSDFSTAVAAVQGLCEENVLEICEPEQACERLMARAISTGGTFSVSGNIDREGNPYIWSMSFSIRGGSVVLRLREDLIDSDWNSEERWCVEMHTTNQSEFFRTKIRDKYITEEEEIEYIHHLEALGKNIDLTGFWRLVMGV